MAKNREAIAIYSRKSKFTGKGESIGNQIDMCKEYVKNFFGSEYLDKIEIFEDEGYSGGNLFRPDFQRAARSGFFVSQAQNAPSSLCKLIYPCHFFFLFSFTNILPEHNGFYQK